MECMFKRVFAEDCSQKEVFAQVGLPLVEDLINGKNGSCFPLVSECFSYICKLIKNKQLKVNKKTET